MTGQAVSILALQNQAWVSELDLLKATKIKTINRINQFNRLNRLKTSKSSKLNSFCPVDKTVPNAEPCCILLVHPLAPLANLVAASAWILKCKRTLSIQIAFL